MKATGIVRKLDGLGRLVIPMEIRRELKLRDGERMEMFVEGNRIVFQKYGTCCHCCGQENITAEVLGISLCSTCLDDLNKARELTDKLTERLKKNE